MKWVAGCLLHDFWQFHATELPVTTPQHQKDTCLTSFTKLHVPFVYMRVEASRPCVRLHTACSARRWERFNQGLTVNQWLSRRAAGREDVG